MYVYTSKGEYDHVSVNVYMKTVHDHMYMKYKLRSHNGEKTQAEKLEQFFQGLKNYAKHTEGDSNYIEDSLYQMLIDQIDAIEKRRGGHHKVTTLFRRIKKSNAKSGARFEQDLADVYQAIVELHSGKIMDGLADEALAGTEKATTGAIVTDEIQKIYKDMNETINKKIPIRQAPYTLVNVQQKIDVEGKGLEIEYNLSLGNNFAEITQIINEATFTAKAYKGKMSSIKDFNELYPDLKLGDSDNNPYRAISGVLNDFGANSKTIASAFCASWNFWKKTHNRVFGNYIYRLRYIYELTGAGILDKNGNLKKIAKYLIYTDLSGDGIYVASTAEIVYQLLDSNLQEIKNPFGRAITIRKSSMRTHRYHET